jgi:predicted RND superfamily exporter protein
MSRLPARPASVSAGDPSAAGRAIEGLYVQLAGGEDRASQKAAGSLDAFLDRFENLSLSQQSRFLADYQQRLADVLYAQFQAIASATSLEPVTMRDLPPELMSRFVSSQGKWLLQIYPKEQVWDREPLARFVADVRSVDPEVTGTPLQNFEASQQIRESYEKASIYALAVICLVLLIDFLRREHRILTLVPPLVIVGFNYLAMRARQGSADPVWLIIWYVAMAGAVAAILDFRNLCFVLLAMLPPLAGGAMMLGILALCGVNLNPANLIVLPLVLGIGVDNGVHVIHDFFRQKGPFCASASTLNAIVLTSVTNMIGFGSMMIAAHRGLFSVGLVLMVGVGSCLFVALVTLPAILTLISRSQSAETKGDAAPKQREQKQQPERRQARAA